MFFVLGLCKTERRIYMSIHGLTPTEDDKSENTFRLLMTVNW